MVNTKDSYKNLLSKIQDSPKPFIQQVYIIETPEELESKQFDVLVKKVNQQFTGRTYGKHLNAIVGVQPVADRRNLAIKPTVDDIFLQELRSQDYDPHAPSSKWMTSEACLGVALGIILAFGMVYAALQLFAIQSPSSFVDHAIDWGKIEK